MDQFKITNEDELNYNLYELTNVLNDLLYEKQDKSRNDQIALKREFDILQRFANENKQLYEEFIKKLEEEYEDIPF